MTCEVFPLKEHCLTFRAGRYLAATCNMLQGFRPFVNTYFEKKIKKQGHLKTSLLNRLILPAS